MTRRANVAMGSAQAAERVGFIVMRVTPALFDRTLVKRTGLGETGQILAVGPEGRLRSNPPLLSAKAGGPVAEFGLDAARLTGTSFVYAAADGTRMAATAPVTVLGAPWTVLAEQTEAEAIGAAQALLRTLAAIVLGVLAATAMLGLAIARSIVGPLGALTAALKALADREQLAEVPGSRRRDEIGDIARAVTTIRDLSLEEAAQQLRTAEATRLREEQGRSRLLREFADRFENSVGGIVVEVSRAMAGLQTAAARMRRAVTSTEDRSISVAGAARQTAGNVDTVAAAAEELGTTVGEIGRQVRQASDLSAAAVRAASRTEQAVTILTGATTRIGDVVDLVSTIAGQTNLLALNATIEASRAGAAGRGFAVVAAEVKELAGQTARATGDIGRQITAIQQATDETRQAIQDIVRQIQAMNGVTTIVAAAIEEQDVTTQEIVRSMAQASSGTKDVTSNIAEVAQDAAASGQAAEDVARAADVLEAQSTRLQAELNQFLSNVRAA
jgi:methyl-accepting chemotaxis protein